MKKITLLLFFIAFTNVFAQKQISGNVKDDKNEPLFGVNVIEKGTSNGVSTDADGSFKIKVKGTSKKIKTLVGKIPKSTTKKNRIDKTSTSLGSKSEYKVHNLASIVPKESLLNNQIE